jgi:hypothetical protein
VIAHDLQQLKKQGSMTANDKRINRREYKCQYRRGIIKQDLSEQAFWVVLPSS